MSLMKILEMLLIGPLKLVFEIIYNLAYRMVGHPGLAIIFLSLVMNVLVLPLYKQADMVQEKAKNTEERLAPGVAHIKKTFSGDERMMILQTYYRQMHYKPASALSGSVSLLLEIPFFMAAYQFLSNLTILDGVSFGPIADLGAPDALFMIGSFPVNVLPILMTVINVVSSAIYLKGFPLKSKIQLYAMALFFLVFLYTSPSCLVFYWTLNNLFSLIKNIFYKIPNPKRVLQILCAALGVGVIVYTIGFFETPSLKVKLVLLAVGAAMLVPLAWEVLKKWIKLPAAAEEPKPDKKTFLLGSLFLTVLVGVHIPATFVAASPQEFVDIYYFHNPLWYIVASAAMAAGLFLVWLRVFYWLSGNKGKVLFARLVWVLSGLLLVNYMFFGTDMGVITATLQYTDGFVFGRMEQLVNLAVLAVLAAALYFIGMKFKKVPGAVLLIAVLALGCMSGIHLVKIYGPVKNVADRLDSYDSEITLSKTGKNVVVITADRAKGEYLPFALEERPELLEAFDGFTYYNNTFSFGKSTNFCMPAVLGGYEYTPVEMNRRADEPLVDKHNEALKMMPQLFSDNGYQVTVVNPSYANYRLIPDVSIYNEIENCNAYLSLLQEEDIDFDAKKAMVENNTRNFFCFSLMKTMPLAMQYTLYDGGRYLQIQNGTGGVEEATTNQVVDTKLTATGINSLFQGQYDAMDRLPEVTKITDSGENTFLHFNNEAPHEWTLLQLPDYVPAQNVDNSAYPELTGDRTNAAGQVLKMRTGGNQMSYHSYMATMLKLAEWFDYLREQGVYDNTRIIIVSDHGQDTAQMEEFLLQVDGEGMEEFLLDGTKDIFDASRSFPLLMVKDFGATGFTVNSEFMTNADTPVLAMDGLIENPVNPYTGKPINSDEKTAHGQIGIMSGWWNVNQNDGNTFKAATWYQVTDNIWDKNNWTFYAKEEIVLDEHKLPQ